MPRATTAEEKDNGIYNIMLITTINELKGSVAGRVHTHVGVYVGERVTVTACKLE